MYRYIENDKVAEKLKYFLRGSRELEVQFARPACAPTRVKSLQSLHKILSAMWQPCPSPAAPMGIP